jgi:uncharacterized protein YecE (DUF72 family)
MTARRRTRTDGDAQRTLFDAPVLGTAAERAEQESLARERAVWEPIARRIPADVRFGTSSWSFPGWRGLVYPHAASASALARDGLLEYARHPLLRTVGIDRGYYAPIPDADLQRYAAQTPEDFRFCAKAPERVVSPVITAHRDRHRAGERNEDFLSVSRFVDEMVGPMSERLGSRLGPFLLEFPPVPPERRLRPGEFADALEDFLSELPRGLSYAVELRDRALITPAYRDALARRRVAHVFNYWSFVPSLAEQAALLDPRAQPVLVIRLLLRPGTRYEAQREAFAPFDRIVEADEAMRAQVTDLLASSLPDGRSAFVLVNNKAEGCSPRTVTALAERLVRALSP